MNIADNASHHPEHALTSQIVWLRAELDRQLSRFVKRRRRDKRKSFALQMSTVVLSASITVLLGLRVTGTLGERFSDIALMLGALATVLAAAEAFFHHRELWLLRTGTLRQLEALDRKLSYYEASPSNRDIGDGQIDRYVAELDRILAEDYVAWSSLQRVTTSLESHAKGSTSTNRE